MHYYLQFTVDKLEAEQVFTYKRIFVSLGSGFRWNFYFYFWASELALLCFPGWKVNRKQCHIAMPLSVEWRKEKRDSGLDQDGLRSSTKISPDHHGRSGKSLGKLTSAPMSSCVLCFTGNVYGSLYFASEWGLADMISHPVGINSLTPSWGSCRLNSLGGQ